MFQLKNETNFPGLVSYFLQSVLNEGELVFQFARSREALFRYLQNSFSDLQYQWNWLVNQFHW